MKHLDEVLAYDILSIPTFTKREKMLIDYIESWSDNNSIFIESDSYGNIYLTKGIIDKDEYFPCLTAHLDSVHKSHLSFIDSGELLQLKREQTDSGTKVFVDGIGIGGDDKAGVAIILSMFKYFDTLKVVFFVEEEGGSFGSKQMNISWFDNVGYVIGYDSPELNRAAHSSKGNRLFTDEFYKEHIKKICDKSDVTNFKAELNTDVRVIREKVSIQCMNFGSGYYNPHSSNEYVVMEDMDKACAMGIALLRHLGNKLYYFEKHTAYLSYIKYDIKKCIRKVKKKFKLLFNFF